MDHIYPPYRTIEDELDEPRTHFMRKVLHEIEDDIGETSSSELDYDYTREQVDYLIHRHMVETAVKYKQREAMFCQRQLAQTENEPKRFKISLPVNAERHNAERDNADSDNDEDDSAENDNVESDNVENDNVENYNVENYNVENENMETDNAEDSFAVSELNESVNDDNYLADAEINDLSDPDDNDPTADCLKRKMYSRQKKQYIKKERQTRSDRLAFISHRIHFSLRELFNARQFIRQAEENIKARGGENLIAMERAREAYCNPRRVVTDAVIIAGLAVTMGVNTKAAAEFDAEIHPPRYPDDSDFRDS